MDFETYQKQSRKTAIYPDQDKNWQYPALGLSGEVGELLNKLKKVIRDGIEVNNEEFKQDVAKELGDVLWYLSNLATEFNLSLDEVAQKNIEKLLSRMERGKIVGQGDNR